MSSPPHSTGCGLHWFLDGPKAKIGGGRIESKLEWGQGSVIIHLHGLACIQLNFPS